MSQHLVYVTAATNEEARAIAKTIVAERLAGALEWVYWWDGPVQSEPEVSFILKTKSELLEPLIARIKALHSYDCPCVVALPIAVGNLDFLNFIDKKTV